MRKFTFLFISLLFSVFSLAKTVTISQVSIVADNYMSYYSGKTNLSILSTYSVQYDGIIVYYVYNFKGGGFVVVAADDAVVPVLAQSNEGYIDQEIDNPNAKYWFDSYSEQIGHIITSGLDNTETLKRWNRILNHQFDRIINDAGPLLTTTWDQGEWYNYYCPVDAGGQGGHVWAGCVATAMAQIMKYYNFPEQGFLSHSYEAPNYGIQTVNFGESIYNWGAMGNSASSSGYQDIATLLYHVGVSVNMNYSITGSGASYEAVKWALPMYFNYDPLNISILQKKDYADSDWKELLKSELHALHPVLYGGESTNANHAWVCDGWRWSDDTFHMNWGWSGNYDGWFWMEALNTWAGSYNKNNIAVTGIKPGNPDLAVRITNMIPNQLIACNSSVPINCSVLKGITGAINLYVDNNLVYTDSQSSFTYNLPTTGYTLGSHTIKVEAFNTTDTAYHQVIVRNSEWISQASAFVNPSRGINHLHAVDSLIVWATGYDGVNVNSPIQEFTRTTNGGETWASGIIPDCSGLIPSMIFGLNADTAYCPMFWQSGTNPQGIYVTTDGGVSWVKQTTASFSDPASFPNVVHFFDNNHGFCMGDPVGGEYEIYLTDNGGMNWTRLSADSIPDPVFGEFGVTGYYSSVGDNAWFGTNNGKVYRTNSGGLHWEVSPTFLNGKYVDVDFADQLHGLAQDKNTNTTGALSETFDGGVTWTLVNPVGQIGTNDFCFVPGTENTWVSTGLGTATNPHYGIFYSCDGGHSWAPFIGNESEQMNIVDFVSARTGWVSGFNTSSTDGGMFKYIGIMPSGDILSPVSELVASIADRNVHLEWNAPGTGTVLGYNVYRGDTLLNMFPLTGRVYNDNQVANGHHTYCVKAFYNTGESDAVCTDAWITYGIPENKSVVKVYPIPASEVINIETPVNFSKVRILTVLGQEVYSYSAPGNKLKILTSGFKPGIYLIQITIGDNILTRNISIR